MREEECANLLSQRMRTAANEETAQDRLKFSSQKADNLLELRSPLHQKINLGGGGGGGGRWLVRPIMADSGLSRGPTEPQLF